MVIKYCFLFLNLYIACSYQPKIQKWVLISWASSCNWNRITILVSTPMFSGLMIRMEKNILEHWRIWIKFKMATDEMFFVIVLKTSTWLENTPSCIWTCICYSLTNLSWNLNRDTQCSQSNEGITLGFNWHIESYLSWPRYTLVSGSPGKWKH